MSKEKGQYYEVLPLFLFLDSGCNFLMVRDIISEK